MPNRRFGPSPAWNPALPGTRPKGHRPYYIAHAVSRDDRAPAVRIKCTVIGPEARAVLRFQIYTPVVCTVPVSAR